MWILVAIACPIAIYRMASVDRSWVEPAKWQRAIIR
ncbi:hypothetical protein [Caudoviricetes sp.]|nr:hypothetical protein [Caudoviricetes sp.]